jgi:heptosyltransferase-2
LNSPAKILVVGPSWVGDMVMAQSLLMSLKAAHPRCPIDVLAPPWSAPLLARMPEVNQSIALPLDHGQFGFITRYKLGRKLRSEGYRHAIVLPNSWKSALIPFFAGIVKRTGYIGECRWGLLNDVRKLDKSRLTMTAQRFVALGLPDKPGLPLDFQYPRIAWDKTGQQAVIQKFGLNVPSKILALCPGAEYGPSKRWPAAYFAEVANVKLVQGWQVWLMGAGKDKMTAMEINRLTGNKCIDFTGKTALIEAIDLISLADSVVANDSGLMHLAAALQKKVIAIYGSTSPQMAPPLSDNAEIISLNLKCSPCRKRICPLYPEDHPEHTKCLTGIKPSRIIELIGA